MTLEQILARLGEIRSALEAGNLTDEQITAFKNEITSLEARKMAIEAMQTRSMNAQLLNNGQATPAAVFAPSPVPENTRTMYAYDSEEYRTAWLKHMLYMPLTAEEEARTAFVHTTGTTSGQTGGNVVPKRMLDRIFSLIEEEHSIVEDIDMLRDTGVAIEIPIHTEIAAGDAGTVAEGAAPSDDEKNVFAKVTLSGKDFAKTIEISYALGIMSIDAFEQYLTNELAERMGAALAADVISQIGTDYYSTGNDLDVATSGKITWTDLTNALSVLKNAKNIKIYASQTTIYKYIVGMVDTTGRPIFQQTANEGIRGTLMGFPVRKEDAITDDIVWIGDPTKVTGNMIQGIMVESDRDIKKHVLIYSGYARFECKLKAPKAFAKLDVTP